MRRPFLPTAETLAAAFPWLVAGYFLTQIVIRLLLSSNLEPDEAEMAISPFWALGYGNSQPPLYHWMVLAAYQVTGYWPLAIALMKNALLAATYLLAFGAGRRATGSAVGGALCAAGLLLLPQVVWESQIALSHSVLATASAAALTHALVLVFERPSLRRYVWLGVAAGAGLYSKYNFILLLGLMCLAVLTIPAARRRLDLRGIALSATVAALMFAPHAIWALFHFAESTARLSRMARPGDFAGIDLPFVGLDGFLSFLADTAAAAGPLVAIWYLVRRLSGAAPDPAQDDMAAVLRHVLGRMLLVAAIAVPLGLLAFDAHSFPIRYLTPLLVPLPLWLALTAPQNAKGAQRFLIVCFTVAALVTIAWPQTTLFGRHRFAYPYAELGAAMTADTPAPFAILGERPDFAENFVLRIPGSAYFRPDEAPPRVLVVWIKDGVGAELMSEAGTAYTPAGPERTYTQRHYFWSGNVATIHAQMMVRR